MTRLKTLRLRSPSLTTWGVYALAALFLVLRLIGLRSAYFWHDDVLTIAPINDIAQPVPWQTFLPETLSFALTDITGPILPTIISRGIANVFGLNLVLLRLPALAAALASLFLLYRILTQAVRTPAARLTPLLLFTLSAPAIIYSQAIQPTIYYCLATLVQLYVTLRGLRRLGPSSTPDDVAGVLYQIGYVSAAVFLLNYVSAIIYGILTLYVLLYVFATCDTWARTPHAAAILLRETMLAALPVALLSLLRLGLGGTSRTYFEGIYYPSTWQDLPRLAYDFLTYHLNFAFGPEFYQPLGANWLALPFIVIALIGLIAFVQRSWRHALSVLAAFVLVTLVAAIGVTPVGGVRHSFTFAPAIYLSIGYGLEALSTVGAGKRPGMVARWSALTLAGLAILIFIGSGWRLYPARASSIDLTKLVALAQAQDIRRIAAYRDTYAILAIRDQTEHGILEKHGLRLEPFEVSDLPEEPYLLVSYASMFDVNPAWPPYAYAVLPHPAFTGAQVTPLLEEPGPLDPLRMRMILQSIYWPLNGFFVYKIDPRG